MTATTRSVDDTVEENEKLTFMAVKVFIMMHSGDRYQKYWMQVRGRKLVIYTESPQEDKAMRLDLNPIHTVSVDTPNQKRTCHSRRFFGATLMLENMQNLTIFFMSFSEMEAAINDIITAQAGKEMTRSSQYKLLKLLDVAGIGTSNLVKQRFTKERYLLKAVSKQSSELI